MDERVRGTMDRQKEEAALVKRVSSHDADAFNELMLRFLPMIERYTFRLCRSTEITEDVVQETFLRLWQSADRYDPAKATFSTWLHRIAHNLCMDLFRKHQRLSPLPDDWEGELSDSTVNGTDNANTPQSAFEQHRKTAQVAEALDALPERQRSVLLLSYFQGFSNQEIGTIHDLSIAAVESLLARARRNLTKRLL